MRTIVTILHRLIWSLILCTVPIGVVLDKTFTWWCSRSRTTHLVCTITISPIFFWTAGNIALSAWQAWSFLGTHPDQWKVLVFIAVVAGIFSVLLAIVTILVVLHQKTRHWQHSHPQRFQAALNLWTSLVVGHHHLRVEPGTTVTIEGRAITISGNLLPNTSLHTRRALLRATARAMEMRWRERLHLATSLWYAHRLGHTFLYIPPSAHDQLRTRALVHTAQVGHLRLLQASTDNLTLA